MEDLIRIVLVGAGATLLMDAWAAVLARLNVRGLNLALVGRWIGHGMQGRWVHAAIAQAAPVAGERVLGWLVHYAVGIVFAAMLLVAAGPVWMRHPTPWPALLAGAVSVAAPLFVMQPAMGAGFVSSKTATPLRNVLRSLANHVVFGLGLYVAAVVVEAVAALA